MPRNRLALSVLLTSVITAAATIAVVAHGWVSDDAMITMRYATNLVHGYGAVFNAGERVQGFTHPLWFLLVTFAVLFEDNPLYVSIALGALFTALTVAILVWTVLGRTRDFIAGVALAALIVLLFVASESWLSFQTGGLENSLSHFLIVLLLIEITGANRPRVFLTTFLMGLLFLTRPDFAVLVAPLAALVLYDAFRNRELPAILLASMPVLVWEGFALAYYGTVLPNTLTAKLGIYANLSDSTTQGLHYLADWLAHEPLPAASAAALFVAGLVLANSRYRLAWALGLSFYLASVILAGGDFMRGRFLLPLFVGGSVLGILGLAAASPGNARAETLRLSGPKLRAPALASLAALVALFAVFRVMGPPPNDAVSTAGIVNERMWYQGYQLTAYRATGRLTDSREDPWIGTELRRFASVCGPFTIHSPATGMLAYLSGPRVSVIDTLGLTDSYIARLPRRNLLLAHPRPGHPYKNIPVSYLAARGDISILDGWWDALESGDCNFTARTARYINSDIPFHPPMELPP